MNSFSVLKDDKDLIDLIRKSDPNLLALKFNDI